MKCDLINSGYSNAEYNMNFDRDLVEKVRSSGTPIFRIYGWQPWALSLGKNQSEENFDLEKLKNDGFDIVKRPTGGRAVFHSNEITYALVCKLNGESHHEIYKKVHYFFEEIFSELGIKTDFAKGDIKLNEFYKNELSASCFASSARYELTIDNKKVVGSAQRVIDGVLLQHGSIPLDSNYLRVADYQKNIDREKVRDFLGKISTHLSTSKNVTFNEIVQIIKSKDDN